MDDEWVDELLRRLAALKAEHDARVVAEIAAHGFADDDGSTGAGGPPRPLYWHPWYRGKTWLWEWLESDDQAIRLPVRRPIRFERYDPDAPVSASPKGVLLRKHLAAGPAPYVGRPFWYRWNVAVDEWGRTIAGEVRVTYEDGQP